jgi:hypothetical protein
MTAIGNTEGPSSPAAATPTVKDALTMSGDDEL